MLTINACIIIQCRYDSKRLPGKILYKLPNNKLVLEHIIDSIKDLKFPIIIATTKKYNDDKIENFIKIPKSLE